MDKKILKYKTKKNKLENEILEILNIKKENYENELVNLNTENHIIIDFIDNYLNELKFNNKLIEKKIIITVSGNYSVGKSTFISNLENYILKISNNIFNIKNDDFIDKFVFDNCWFEIKNKITIIEVSNNDIIMLHDKINYHLDNISILNIKILPKDKNSLKNKYINKIIHDIKNNTSNFIQNINIDSDTINTSIQNNIQLLKQKKNIYSDDDFIFLNHVIDYIFNFKSGEEIFLESAIFYL
jgi:hypothetical protein